MAGVHQVLKVDEREVEGWGTRFFAMRNDEDLGHYPTYEQADAYLAGMIRALSEVEEAIRRVA